MGLEFIWGQEFQTLLLNGEWRFGQNRIYTQSIEVPSIVTDASKINEADLWYKKEVVLPRGNWTHACLLLKGARFNPSVYINGRFCYSKEGGMAPLQIDLNDPDINPGSTITIEIALKPLDKIDRSNASYIPEADHWRSNISSCIWDDIELHFSGDVALRNIIPFVLDREKALKVKYSVLVFADTISKIDKVRAVLSEMDGKIIAQSEGEFLDLNGNLLIHYGDKCKPWSPESPQLYKLKVELLRGSNVIDQKWMSTAIKTCEIRQKQLYLNGNPYKLRGASVVWHRWVRNKEGQELAWDTTWFKNNIILQLKDHGANLIRFHLGPPPERILDLCDRYGLIVQHEWIFFHGMNASEQSLLDQLPEWFNLGLRHPSVCLYHPYNETEGDQLNTIWSALNKIVADYPPLILEDRDIIHIHKYWWSLFENLGLYYDSFEQFPKAAMVDEFGGNYLDGMGEMGGYLTLPETFLRFLGQNHTAEMRLHHQTLSNARVAEYWRRIGVTGFAPFVALSSWEDGNHWFLGDLKTGSPKPVWSALTASFSPVSVSLDLWDRNFFPGQEILLPLHVFNDLGSSEKIRIKIFIKNADGSLYWTKEFKCSLPAFNKKVIELNCKLPQKEGKYLIQAEVLNPPLWIKYPVISEWEIKVKQIKIPENIHELTVGLDPEETDIFGFVRNNQWQPVNMESPTAKILLGGRKTWERIQSGDNQLLRIIEKAIDSGSSVVLTDIGMQVLGQGYPADKNDLGPLQGVKVIDNGRLQNVKLCKNLSVKFQEVAEPESHIHLNSSVTGVGYNLYKEDTWLWNGLRGGLIVPASDMVISGMDQESIIALWKSRGADPEQIRKGPYYAYELQGYFDFSSQSGDQEVILKLREKLKFLVEDAPALAGVLDPRAHMKEINLSAEYEKSAGAEAQSIISLAVCGKSLGRSPIVLIDFGNEKGKLVLSQCLMEDRLLKTSEKSGKYDIRYDPATVQLLINLMNIAQ